MRSLGHIRPRPGPAVVPGRGAVEPMAVPFEGDSPSPAGREVFEESEGGVQARRTISPMVNVAEPAMGAIPRPSLEDRADIPGRREVSRTGNEALQMSGVQVTAPPVRPAVTDSQSGRNHTELGPRANGRRKTARGQGPDVSLTATEPPKQDTADRDEPYPLTPPRPAVEPAVVFAQTRNGPRGETEDAPGLSAETVPSASPTGDKATRPSRLDAPDPSTRVPTARATRHGVRNIAVYKNETCTTAGNGHESFGQDFRAPPDGDLGKIDADGPARGGFVCGPGRGGAAGRRARRGESQHQTRTVGYGPNRPGRSSGRSGARKDAAPQFGRVGAAFRRL